MADRRPVRKPSFVRRHPGVVRAVLLFLIFSLGSCAGAVYGAWALVCRAGQCPSTHVLEDYTPRQTSKLYAVDGKFITEIGLERRTLVKLSEIPPVVRNAFVVTEDRRFYSHAGVDFIGLGGALKDRLMGDRLRGASTITQQLARNVFPERISRERSYVRKLKEAKVARGIESRYTKDKILELYLNQISLGNGAYGVETASQRYFGKSVRDLNVAEAATLAALPKAPERYNPRRFPDRAIQRRNTVVNLLRDSKLLNTEEAERWKAYPLLLSSHSDFSGVAEYFVEYVRQQLEARFGRDLYTSGYRIYTTLDLDIQQAAERALEARLEAIESGADGKFSHDTYRQYLESRSDNNDDNSRSPSPYLQGLVVTLEAKT